MSKVIDARDLWLKFESHIDPTSSDAPISIKNARALIETVAEVIMEMVNKKIADQDAEISELRREIRKLRKS